MWIVSGATAVSFPIISVEAKGRQAVGVSVCGASSQLRSFLLHWVANQEQQRHHLEMILLSFGFYFIGPILLQSAGRRSERLIEETSD